jgi:hypothetical protein
VVAVGQVSAIKISPRGCGDHPECDVLFRLSIVIIATATRREAGARTMATPESLLGHGFIVEVVHRGLFRIEARDEFEIRFY